MATSVEYLFKQISNSLDEFIEGNQSYYTFRDEVNKSTDSRYSVSRRYINRNIDLTWVDRIEDCVIPLDTILRAPRNFIKDVEEIVPIAMTRKITSESVKHLATHTNFIQSVEGDKVTPNKILNVYKEESFATYENRFIKTLLNHLDLFVEKRYQGLMSQKDVDNVTAARCDQSFDLEGEHVKYQMEISVHVASEVSEEGLKSSTKSSMANDIERVLKIRTIIRDFMSSPFMGLLADAPEVHPPITKTNLLTKNQDYKKALELWQFIESYAENGYQVDLVDNSNNAIPDYQEKMNQMAFIEYLFLKKYTGQDVDDKIREALEQQLRSLGRESELQGQQQEQNGKFSEESRGAVRKEFRSILGNYQDNLDEVKNIFVQEFERQQRAIKKEEKRLVDAIRRIIAKQKLLEEKERQRRLEEERKRKLKEEKARKKEEERKRKEEEKARLAEEKRIKKEEEAKRKAEEKARLDEEKRLAKEAEKARLAEEKAKKAEEEKKRLEEEKAKKAEEASKKPDFDKFEAARKAVEKAIGKSNVSDTEDEPVKEAKPKATPKKAPKETLKEEIKEEPVKESPKEEPKKEEPKPIKETPKTPLVTPAPTPKKENKEKEIAKADKASTKMSTPKEPKEKKDKSIDKFEAARKAVNKAVRKEQKEHAQDYQDDKE